MKIAICSFIGNEEDIIEEWVRYHARFAHTFFIGLHNSHDNTEHILQMLQREGISLVYNYIQEKHYCQKDTINSMIHDKKMSEFTWIIPLDADEFLCTQHGEVIDAVSQLPDNAISEVSWNTYMPTATKPTKNSSVLKRMQHRLKKEHSTWNKILIPQKVLTNYPGEISLGNHAYENPDVEKHTCNNLYLAHFPVRSEEQLRQKIKIGCESYTHNNQEQTSNGFQWKQLENRCKDPRPIGTDELQKIAEYYTVQSPTEHEGIGELEHAPLRAPQLPKNIVEVQNFDEPRDEDCTFFLQIHHDLALAKATIQRWRDAYPTARFIIQITDSTRGDIDSFSTEYSLELYKTANLFSIEYKGEYWNRFLELFAQKPTRYIFKIDTDTRIDRRLTVRPAIDAISGDLYAQDFVQGGCIIIPYAIALRLHDSGIFKTQLVSKWITHRNNAVPTWLKMSAGEEKISADWMLYWACTVLNIPRTQHPEIYATWMIGTENIDKKYAIMHPDKWLHAPKDLYAIISKYHALLCAVFENIHKKTNWTICKAQTFTSGCANWKRKK